MNDEPKPKEANGANIGGDVNQQGGVGAYGGKIDKIEQHNYYGMSPAPSLSMEPIFTVPYAQNDIFGREQELAQLADLFTSGKNAIVTAMGIGGMGKSFLAAQFAHRTRHLFPGGVFWLNMEHAEDIETQVIAFGAPGFLNLQGWTGKDRDMDLNLVLNAWRRDIARLLIFDNVEDPHVADRWRPKTGGSCVLVTSRNNLNTEWLNATTITLHQLTEDPSLALLCTPRTKALCQQIAELEKRTDAEQKALASLITDPAAKEICMELGYLPLALALAAAFLAKTSYNNISFADYLTILRREANILSNATLDQSKKQVLTDYRWGVQASIALSYDRIAPPKDSTDELALDIFYRAAALAAAPIPRPLLLRTAGLDLSEIGDRIKGGEAIDRLCEVGLVSVETGEFVTMHRLVAEFVNLYIGDSHE